MNKDLIVIGAGPGGYEVAIKASIYGLKVAIVEKGELGGTCLNHGCIPTKALYKSALVHKTLTEALEFGFNNVQYEINFSQIQARKESIVNNLRSNIKMMLEKSNVEIINGEASFLDDHTILVKNGENEQKLTANYFIIATGSVEKTIKISGIDLPNVVTSKELLAINKIPTKLIIVGGGVIGIEFASIFRELGSEVTIYEYMDRILPMFDNEISTRLKALLKKRGIEISNDALVEKIEQIENGLVLTGKTKKGKEFADRAEYILIATGRKAYFDGLNLDKINVLHDKNGIVVNEHMQTTIEHIYAVGDVTGSNMLAHVATFQSFKALDHLLGKENNTNFQVIPSCVFTFPEVAVVGLTEEEAKTRYGEIKTNKYLFRASGKAQTMGEVDGFVKVISADNILVGCHIIGPDASSLIQAATILIERKIPLTEAINIIHAHPTLPEAILEAIRGLI